MKFSIEDFFSKCDQIRRNLRIWSHLLKKSLMESFIFCAVYKDRIFISVLIREYSGQRKPVFWCNARTQIYYTDLFCIEIGIIFQIFCYFLFVSRAVFLSTLKVEIRIIFRMTRNNVNATMIPPCQFS